MAHVAISDFDVPNNDHQRGHIVVENSRAMLVPNFLKEMSMMAKAVVFLGDLEWKFCSSTNP
jgi:hypothetical protein